MPSRKKASGPIANATFHVHSTERVEHREIPVGDDTGEFAPYRGPRVCRSRAGRWRPHHEWDSDGLVCIYCDQMAALEPMED